MSEQVGVETLKKRAYAVGWITKSVRVYLDFGDETYSDSAWTFVDSYGEQIAEFDGELPVNEDNRTFETEGDLLQFYADRINTKFGGGA